MTSKSCCNNTWDKSADRMICSTCSCKSELATKGKVNLFSILCNCEGRCWHAVVITSLSTDEVSAKAFRERSYPSHFGIQPTPLPRVRLRPMIAQRGNVLAWPLRPDRTPPAGPRSQRLWPDLKPANRSPAPASHSSSMTFSGCSGADR